MSCKQHRPCCKNSQKIMESEYCLNLQNFNLFFSFFLVFFPAVFYMQRIGGVCVRARQVRQRRRVRGFVPRGPSPRTRHDEAGQSERGRGEHLRRRVGARQEERLRSPRQRPHRSTECSSVALFVLVFFFSKLYLKADHPLFDWLINCVILNHF